MELEPTQLTQLLRWLEDERRKDKTQIATLQERIAGQANELAELARRIQDLDNSLKGTQFAIGKIQQTDRVLDEFKADMIALVDRRDDDRKKTDRESGRVRLLEIESLQHQLTEIKKELPRIGKLEEELPTRRAEEKRLGEILQRLPPQIEAATQLAEERTRGVPYLEEGRRQDVKRLQAVELEVINLSKRIDGNASKLPVLEDAISKIPPRFDPLHLHLSEHDKALDDLRSIDFRTQQQVKTFEGALAQFKDQLIDYTTVMNKLREQAQINQRAEAVLNAFQETLRMRAAELGEVERLFEERIKRQIEEFQGDFEKRWVKVPVKFDEQWHEHERTHRVQDERLDQIETVPGPLKDAIAELRVEHEKVIQALVTVATSLGDTNRSSLPQFAVPPARMPDDGLGLPTGSSARSK